MTSNEDLGRPIKRVRVSHEAMDQLFKEGTTVVEGLPDDAVVEEANLDSAHWCYEFIVRSESFDPIRERAVIPIVDLVIENRRASITDRGVPDIRADDQP